MVNPVLYICSRLTKKPKQACGVLSSPAASPHRFWQLCVSVSSLSQWHQFGTSIIWYSCSVFTCLLSAALQEQTTAAISALLLLSNHHRQLSGVRLQVTMLYDESDSGNYKCQIIQQVSSEGEWDEMVGWSLTKMKSTPSTKYFFVLPCQSLLCRLITVWNRSWKSVSMELQASVSTVHWKGGESDRDKERWWLRVKPRTAECLNLHIRIQFESVDEIEWIERFPLSPLMSSSFLLLLFCHFLWNYIIFL